MQAQTWLGRNYPRGGWINYFESESEITKLQKQYKSSPRKAINSN